MPCDKHGSGEVIGPELLRGTALPPPSATRLHLSEPDYDRPLLRLTPAQKISILEKLVSLYGEEKAETCFPEVERLLRVHYAHKPPEMIEEDRAFDPRRWFSEEDVILITYGDLVHSPGKRPFVALSDFLENFLRGTINTIHILPFFPHSSDRGFAVIDFEQVDPALGTWEDIEALGTRFRLMFDGVINHVSSQSRWFREFRNGNPEYRDFFIYFSTRQAVSDDHLRLILRPRTSELLTPFKTISGEKYCWTTFSPDQIDLNYKNEKVLLRVIDILLRYIRRGADIVRLDAVTYLWAEPGTRSAYLEETHILVQLFRALLDIVAPQVALVTETNVAHEENIRYFGNGDNEAQLVYNFPLPPLVLHSFQSGSCAKLSAWAGTLEKVSDCANYLNFLDSHDGIPVLPARGILSEAEIDAMIERVKEHQGLVSYRRRSDGSKSPYEMNITWYSALNREDSGEPVELQVDRFIASRAIPLVLRGVPAIYLPGLVGSKNDLEAVLEDESARNINRSAICELCLYERCSDPDSSAYQVTRRFGELIEKRTQAAAFHPNGDQRILHVSDCVFSVIREAPDGSQMVLALINVSPDPQELALSAEDLGTKSRKWRDLLSGEAITADSGRISVVLRPYRVAWLTPATPRPKSR